MQITFIRSSLSVAFVIGLVACTSKSSDGPTGSAVSGATDSHCSGQPAVTVDPATCTAPPAGDAGAGDDGGSDAGAMGDDGGAPKSDYGPTLYNSEGDDDDCKYHVKWTSTAIRENTDVTFNLTTTLKATGKPDTGAIPRLEVFLSDTHPAPNSKQAPTETSPGVYTAGPIRFDAPGRWTVRFHLHENCDDGPTSPHGHAAFFVDVP